MRVESTALVVLLKVREEETWDDWQEGLVEEPCKCLFCPELLPSVANALSHCSTTHGFDLREVIKSSGTLAATLTSKI
jgi:hypothetical protein